MSETDLTVVEVTRPDAHPALSVVRVVGAVTGRPERLAYVDVGETGTQTRVRERTSSARAGAPRLRCDEHGRAEPKCRHIADADEAWRHVAAIEAEEAGTDPAPHPDAPLARGTAGEVLRDLSDQSTSTAPRP